MIRMKSFLFSVSFSAVDEPHLLNQYAWGPASCSITCTGHKVAVDPWWTSLDPVNSTPIWNFLAGAQHMPFLCPHITALTSCACVQKSLNITSFSLSYVLPAAKQSNTPTDLSVHPSSFKWTVSLRAVLLWSHCIDKQKKKKRPVVACFFDLIFHSFLMGTPNLSTPNIA